MFSVRQKRKIAEDVQKILRDTNHPELPAGEIIFRLHIDGAESWSWANIRNNSNVQTPTVNPHNEMQDKSMAAKQNLPNCSWRKVPDENDYLTSCGELFTIIDGSPAGNNMNYCFFCGRVLITHAPKRTEVAT